MLRNWIRFIHLSQLLPIAGQCLLLLGLSFFSWHLQSVTLAVFGFLTIVVGSSWWYFRRQIYHTDLFKSVLESAPVTVFVWDSLLQKVIFINSKAQTQLNLDDRIINSSYRYLLASVIKKEHAAKAIRLMKKTITSATRDDFSLRRQSKSNNATNSKNLASQQTVELQEVSLLELQNGKKISVRLFPLKISQTLNRVLIVGFVEDETEKMKLKNALDYEKVKSAHLDRLNSLSEMAGGLAHEINNPLAIISGRAQSMRIKSQQGRLEPIFLLESLKKIEETSLRISKIISGLRTIARDGSNDEFCNISISILIEDVLTFWSQRLRNSNIDIQFNWKNADVMIHCRPVQITQVLLNLIGNSFTAIKDFEEEKWIRIDVESTAESIVEIRIIDSGSGIPLAIKNKIFDPFFTTKPIGEGTGLGLTLAVGVLNDHHGYIRLDESCSNTCFIVGIPLATSESRLAA